MSSSLSLDRRDRADDFLCGDNGAGVVRDIDVERGMHFFIRVIRRRVFYQRDHVAAFRGVANGRFDAGMCYQSDHDELMDAVLLELQVQVGVGEATGTPVFLGDNLTWRRHEFGTEL